MPLYEYRCPDCGHEFEEIQKVQGVEKVVEVPRQFMVPVDRIVEVPQHIVEERIVEEPRELPCGIRG